MNRIHPTAFIGPGVELGDDNVIGPGAVILGPTRIGDGNFIAPTVVIGAPAEMEGMHHAAAWEGELVGSGVTIGSRNVIREGTTIQGATGEEATWIADGCYLMNKTHVPHDAVVEDGVILAAGASMAGHVRVGAGANIGLGVLVHQRIVIAPGAMVGMGSVVTRHVPPFALAYGVPARVMGANDVGMGRQGIPENVIGEWAECLAADPTGLGAGVPEPLRRAFEWYVGQPGVLPGR